jgi:phenylacetic acid degradation operon negative regulatory protein
MANPSDQRPLKSARSLLLTLLGEHVYPGKQATWTASLLYVLRGLGVEEQSARQAIARCAAAGWIEGERRGRDACWRLTPRGRVLVGESIERVYSLNEKRGPWDGRWLVLLVSIPHQQRAARKHLYSALSWAGFGNPTPGVWLTPHTERADEAREVVSDLGLARSTLSFVGNSASIGLSDDEIVRRAWDLDDIAARYQALLDRYTDARPAAGDDVLFMQIELTCALGRLPFFDPQLPEELLPGWIGREALSRLTDRRTSWFQAGHERWKRVVSRTTPVTGAQARAPALREASRR